MNVLQLRKLNVNNQKTYIKAVVYSINQIQSVWIVTISWLISSSKQVFARQHGLHNVEYHKVPL